MTTAYAEKESCTSGWYITGYFAPVESDYPKKTIKLKIDGKNYKFRKDFVKEVKIEGWGKTLSGKYLGWYNKTFHLGGIPVDSLGNHLKVGTIATDHSIIPLNSHVTIPSLPDPWNKMKFTAIDVGPAITNNHIDVYTGQGKAAQKKTFDITGYENTVCIRP
jgi:3D (Asp-Asp-Asp) domain-containing protein